MAESQLRAPDVTPAGNAHLSHFLLLILIALQGAATLFLTLVAFPVGAALTLMNGIFAFAIGGSYRKLFAGIAIVGCIVCLAVASSFAAATGTSEVVRIDPLPTQR